MAKITFLTPAFAVAAQLEEADFAHIVNLGFKTVINNRPDGEEDDQLVNNAAAAHALKLGLRYHYIPAGKLDLFSDPVVDAFEAAIATSAGPVLAYCKSGTRSSIIWAAASARSLTVDDVLTSLLDAGFDFDFLRSDLEQQSSIGPRCSAVPEEELPRAA